MKNTPNNSEFLYTIPNDFENTESNLKPFYYTDLKNTFENIVLKGKSTKENAWAILEFN